MADQKDKKKFSAGIFGIFECLLNPSNQSSLLSWFFKTNKDEGGRRKEETLPGVLLEERKLNISKY